jgi:copper chaperone CopZ
MRPAVLALATRALGTLSLGPACNPPAAATTAATTVLELKVGGMHCEPCAAAITAAVQKLDGVQSCSVDHVAGTAVVRHDPARADAAAIVAAITRLGYTATP